MCQVLHLWHGPVCGCARQGLHSVCAHNTRGLPLVHQLNKLWQAQAKATWADTTAWDVDGGDGTGGGSGGSWFLHIDGDLKGDAVRFLKHRCGILQRQLWR